MATTPPLLELLAGPILQDVSSARLLLWCATADPAPLTARVFAASGGMFDPARDEPIGTGVSAPRRIATRKAVHAIEVRAAAGRFRFGTAVLLELFAAEAPERVLRAVLPLVRGAR